MRKVKIGLVGLGHWGPNLLRNFMSLENGEVEIICDSNPKALRNVKGEYPQIAVTEDYLDVTGDERLDAVVIATPAATHYSIAKSAVERGKHIFVEKPITLSVREAEELVKLSERRGVKLMVGHLLLYHNAIRTIKHIIESGAIGRLYYTYQKRVNLGKVRSRENVLWSFSPHDISTAMYLLGETPTNVVAFGGAYLQKGIEDVVFLKMGFSEGRISHIHASWLDPTRERKLVIVGEKGMIVFDEVSGKLQLMHRGVRVNSGPMGEVEFDYFDDEIGNIYYKPEEPLRLECQHFLECILEDRIPLSDGRNGVEVLKVLEAADRSLRG
ncbi:MAG: Gfo/Idh/MocA family protein [bacterium]